MTITVSVTFPPGTGNVEAALIADELRTHAQRQVAARDGRTTISVSNPHTFATTGRSTARALPPGDGPPPVAAASAPHRRGSPERSRSPGCGDRSPAHAAGQARGGQRPSSPSTAPDDSLVIDLFGRRVRIDGQDVDFTYKEFELLSQLAQNARRTVGRTELMETVWAESPDETGERTVDVHVRRVRTKLGRYRRLISTVRGAGYRLDPGSDVAILG